MALTADVNYVIESGSSALFRYNTTEILCAIAVSVDDVVAVDIQVWNTAHDVLYGSSTARFTTTEIDAKSSAESGESAVFRNCVEQCVADYLDALTGNASVTFTVSA